ncbi:MAG TPA: fluoride efflux transporter CrcB [Chthoniobacterales bacterium]|jgi:CrcB protein
MLNYILVMLGGAIGTGARFWLSGLVAVRYGETFPLGTMIVNVSGCFLVGVLATTSDPLGYFVIAPNVRQFLLLGICGGYTTFSSFSLQTLDLARDGDWLRAALNVVLSLALCFLGTWAGRALALALVGR